jgi:hypothetical protein
MLTRTMNFASFGPGGRGSLNNCYLTRTGSRSSWGLLKPALESRGQGGEIPSYLSRKRRPLPQRLPLGLLPRPGLLLSEKTSPQRLYADLAANGT